MAPLNARHLVVDATVRICHWNKRLIFWHLSSRKPKLAAYWLLARLRMLCRLVWDEVLHWHRCTTSYIATTGANLYQTSIIPNLTQRPKRPLKKLPEMLSEINREWLGEGPIRLMFQNEARFGRISDVRRSWCPRPYRPMCQAMVTT